MPKQGQSLMIQSEGRMLEAAKAFEDIGPHTGVLRSSLKREFASQEAIASRQVLQSTMPSVSKISGSTGSRTPSTGVHHSWKWYSLGCVPKRHSDIPRAWLRPLKSWAQTGTSSWWHSPQQTWHAVKHQLLSTERQQHKKLRSLQASGRRKPKCPARRTEFLRREKIARLCRAWTYRSKRCWQQWQPQKVQISRHFFGSFDMAVKTSAA